MKLIRISNCLIIIITSLISLFYGVKNIITNDIYEMLICLSIIPIMFLPYIIKRLFKIKINDSIIFMYLIFIFFAHFLGSIINLYNSIKYYDRIAHLISGILTSFGALIILILFKHYNPKKIIFSIIFIFSFSLAIAGLWEVFEFSFDKLFDKDAQHVRTTGVNDTMFDIIAAFLGTSLFSVLYACEEKTGNKIIIKYFIKELTNDE